jgi:hypothetical protein
MAVSIDKRLRSLRPMFEADGIEIVSAEKTGKGHALIRLRKGAVTGTITASMNDSCTRRDKNILADARRAVRGGA